MTSEDTLKTVQVSESVTIKHL